MGDGRLGRREFLRLAAGGAACAAAVAAGAGCSSGGPGKARAEAESKPGPTGRRQLRIAQVGHFVPGYDAWFDNEYTPAWGERNNIEVIVDHIPVGELPARAAAEATSRKGHDLFAFLTPSAAFEDDVVDLSDVVQEIQAKVGKPSRLAERSGYNPKTNKWYGVPEYWSAELVNYRTDFWAGLGTGGRPDTWADLLAAGPKLKAAGHPIGLDMSSDLDGNLNLLALMFAHGAFLQTEDATPALDRPATVAAVKAGAALWSTSQPPETLSWNDASANNRHLAGGRGSLILNPISALRAVEKQDAALARNIGLAPVLAGPGGRLSPTGTQSTYVIWNFAENQDGAKRFLVDLILSYRDAFLHSEFYNYPAFPGSVPDLADLVAKAPAEPAGKYAVLAQGPDWSTNVGHPGSTNAAVDDVYNQNLIPKMFGVAARGEMTAEQAVAATAA
ncbi:MAG TPA: extracellular solute-binding protein, partial [Acidimicrobiia bacterium]